MLTKLTPAEYNRTIYQAVFDTINLENLLRPEYWAHVARMLKQFDRVEIISTDGTRYIELIVAACAPLWARMVVVHDVELAKTAAPVKKDKKKPDFKAEFDRSASAGKKWRVIRFVDNQVLQEGLESKEIAEGWIETHKAQLAGGNAT